MIAILARSSPVIAYSLSQIGREADVAFAVDETRKEIDYCDASGGSHGRLLYTQLNSYSVTSFDS